MQTLKLRLISGAGRVRSRRRDDTLTAVGDARRPAAKFDVFTSKRHAPRCQGSSSMNIRLNSFTTFVVLLLSWAGTTFAQNVEPRSDRDPAPVAAADYRIGPGDTL